MATPSPAPSNNSTDTAAATTTPATASKILAQTPTSTNIKSISSPSKSAFSFQRDQPKNLRGLNKPKCSQCGNVARSRCPYESCKSCCAKAENPCPIHVLKQAGTVPDKKPASTSLFDQKSNDASQPGTSLRVSSLRQLSQFNGTQVPFRPRKPPTRKEAAALNQWRFSKLKEYKERDIEAENEAFDRYMQNVSLLEEAFLVNSSPDTPIDPSSTSKEENTRKIILGFKAQLRSNLKRSDNFKRRIQDIVDQGLSKLQRRDLTDFEESLGAKDLDGHKETKKLKKTKDARAERASAIDELTDKLNKARNEEDLQTCLNMKCQLFNQPVECCSTGNVADTSKEQTLDNGPKPKHELNILPPKLWRRTEVDHESLHAIDVHFSSLDQIEDL